MSTPTTNETAAPQPAGSVSTANGKFNPVPCNVRVLRDTAGQLSGKVLAQVAPQGLILYPKSGKPLAIRPGSKVKYLGDNRLTVTLDQEGATEEKSAPRELSLRIHRMGSYQNLLTLDTVAYLNGDIERLNASYSMPFYLFLPALLPLGLPLFGWYFMVNDKVGWQQRIYELVGLGVAGLLLFALCIVIAFAHKTKEIIRVFAALMFSGLAYLGVAALVGAVPMPNVYKTVLGRDPFEQVITWKFFSLPEDDLERVTAHDAPQFVKEYERDMSNGHTTKFRRFEMVAAPEANFYVDIALVPDEVYATYMLETELHERDFKEDFPGVTEVTSTAIENATHRTDDDYFIPGRDLRGILPNGYPVMRQMFIIRDRIYVLTVVGKRVEVPRFVHETYFDGIAIYGMKPKRDTPQAAAPGGAAPAGDTEAPKPSARPVTTATRPKPTFPKPTGVSRGDSGERREGGGRRGGRRGSSPAAAEESPAPTKPDASAPSGPPPAEPKPGD